MAAVESVLRAVARPRIPAWRELRGEARAQVLAALVVLIACGALVIVDYRGPLTTSPVTQLSYWPLILPGSLAVLTMVSVVISAAARRSNRWTRVAISALVVVIAAYELSFLSLLVGHRTLLVVAGLVAAAVGLTTSPDWPATRRTLAAAVTTVGSAAAGLMALLSVLTADGLDRDLVALREQLLVAQVPVVLSVLAVFAVVSSVRGRHEAVDDVSHEVTAGAAVRPWLVAVVVTKLALFVALYAGVVGDAFGGHEFWDARLRTPTTWLHVAVVALLLYWAAVMPARRGSRTWSLATVLTVALVEAVGAVAFLVFASATIAFNDAFRPKASAEDSFARANWALDHLDRLWFAGAVVLLVVGLLPFLLRRRDLVPFAITALVAGVWLLPVCIKVAFPSFGAHQPSATLPGQVDLALTVGVAVLLVARPAHSRRDARYLRLMLLALIALTAYQVVPDSWIGSLWRVLPVVAVAWAVATQWPQRPESTDVSSAGPSAGSQDAFERSALLFLAGQLLLLVCFFVGLGDAELNDHLHIDSTLAWLWLSVPVVASMALRQPRASGAGSKRTSHARGRARSMPRRGTSAASP